MHKLNVVHGNLKSVCSFHCLPSGRTLTFLQTNVLIDPGGHAYVAGLGTAPLSPTGPGVDIDRFSCGTAPELVDPQRFGSSSIGATKASDMYAFAILSWEVSIEFVARLWRVAKWDCSPKILAGQVPFSNECRIAAVFSMLGGRRPARPNHPELSNRLWRMIEGCWKVDPTQRKTITKVVAVLEAGVAARRSRSRLLYRNRT